MKTITIDGEKYLIIKEIKITEMLKSAYERGIEQGSMVTQDAIYSNQDTVPEADPEADHESLLVFGSD